MILLGFCGSCFSASRKFDKSRMLFDDLKTDLQVIDFVRFFLDRALARQGSLIKTGNSSIYATSLGDAIRRPS